MRLLGSYISRRVRVLDKPPFTPKTHKDVIP